MSRLLDSIRSIPQLTPDSVSSKKDNSSLIVKKFMQEGSERKSSKDDMDYLDATVEDIIGEVNEDFSDDDDFNMDAIFDSFADSDADVELQNNLISLGRRYSHEGGGSKEVSDLKSQFVPQESALKKLISDLDQDISSVGKDITTMRLSRSRNFKAMSDLISAQSSLYSTKLSAIKEQNNIKKTIADLQLKIDGKNSSQEDASATATMAIQQLFSGGADTPSISINSDDISTSAGDSQTTGTSFDDASNIKNLFGNEETTEGDIYLKYEDRNVSIHCVVDKDTGDKKLVAKDSDGVVIPEYPLPQNADDLIFTLHDDLGTATDNLGRDYILDYE